ncbi:4651_t:CDS:2 [Funneliformis caledonium]|uniref:4651_t:CDS:1 n=1 Tax=Funneliformis caledonium TaxID=1117310 RepID=A0A9N9DCR3_9GLOM|nr:4651_t:CDS:2 [Funneliformis caledonium]
MKLVREKLIMQNKLKLENDAHKRENENAKKKLDLEFEAYKQNTELWKELLLAYMKIMVVIIEQNYSIFQSARPLLNQLKDEKLPSSVKGNIEKVINQAFEVQY